MGHFYNDSTYGCAYGPQTATSLLDLRCSSGVLNLYLYRELEQQQRKKTIKKVFLAFSFLFKMESIIYFVRT